MKNSKTGYYLKLALTLLLISAVVSGLLGLTNYITADKIAEITAQKAAASMQEVLPAEQYDPLTYTGEDTNVVAIYQAGTVGYVVEVEVAGSQDTIDMMVGIGTDGTVTGVSIIDMSETSGLGANASKESFREQYIGRSGTLAVDKDGGDIDALTGATITSRAVTNGVNSALNAAAEAAN